MLERLNQEIKRRSWVVRIFPSAERCLRLVRALAAETHENWPEATRYLNMDHLIEHKKAQMRQLQEAAQQRPAGGLLALYGGAAPSPPNKHQKP